eukprot:UN08090
MTPLQREISESDDIVIFQQKQFDELFGDKLEPNKVPTPQDLARTMALYWDEGINFAKKVAVESQTLVRHDVFKQGATVQQLIGRDEVDAIVYDDDMIGGTPQQLRDMVNTKKSANNLIGEDIAVFDGIDNEDIIPTGDFQHYAKIAKQPT